MKILLTCGLIVFGSMSFPFAQSQEKPPLLEDLVEDEHFREEHGLNFFTAPSIDLIFEQLDKLAPLPLDEVPNKIPKRMPIERADLALEIGLLISEGFLTVQAGNLDEIQPLAKTLSRYANALGAGDKVKGHAQSILEHAKKNNIKALKKELAATQRDVEKELILLQDVDLAHLISLGGWIRALEISSHAVNDKYTEERAKLLYREDIADYYEYSLSSLNPELQKREDIKKLKEIITAMKSEMLLEEGAKPTAAGVKKIHERAKSLVENALKRAM